MEKMVVHNDGRVGCVCSERIYEEAFGRDGIDPCKRVLDPNWLKRAKYRVIYPSSIHQDKKKETEKLWR